MPLLSLRQCCWCFCKEKKKKRMPSVSSDSFFFFFFFLSLFLSFSLDWLNRVCSLEELDPARCEAGQLANGPWAGFPYRFHSYNKGCSLLARLAAVPKFFRQAAAGAPGCRVRAAHAQTGLEAKGAGFGGSRRMVMTQCRLCACAEGVLAKLRAAHAQCRLEAKGGGVSGGVACV